MKVFILLLLLEERTGTYLKTEGLELVLEEGRGKEVHVEGEGLSRERTLLVEKEKKEGVRKNSFGPG